LNHLTCASRHGVIFSSVFHGSDYYDFNLWLGQPEALPLTAVRKEKFAARIFDAEGDRTSVHFFILTYKTALSRNPKYHNV
jgi:hypothetical protein